MPIPVQIKQAATAIWLTLVIDVLSSVVAARLGHQTQAEMFSQMAMIAMYCVVAYNISLGSNAARYVFLALFCQTMLSAVPQILSSDLAVSADEAKISALELIDGFANIGLSIFALFKLFQLSTNKWYLAKRQWDSGTA